MSEPQTQACVEAHANGDARFLSEIERVFPNLAVECHDGLLSRFVEEREVAGYPIARVVSPGTSAYRSHQKAGGSRKKDLFKFVWQLSGTLQYHDVDHCLSLGAGEATLLSMSASYQLDMDEAYTGLMLIFDAGSHAPWREAAHRHQATVIGMNGASAAASAAALALLSHARGDRSDELAVQSSIELVFASLNDDGREQPYGIPEPMQLRRAAAFIKQNISDSDYGPDQLARDLGLSRRSLYNRFGELGVTPAQFIRYQRLQSVRAEILRDQAAESRLESIALRNGFPDSASLSHAFKAAYGVPPSRLRGGRERI